MTTFIDLIETGSDEPRVSSLAINSTGSPHGLTVIGVLPHNYSFKPREALDRDMLVDWLNELEYTE